MREGRIGASGWVQEEAAMSLRCEPLVLVPEETAKVARAAFPSGNLYMRLSDQRYDRV